MFCQVDAGFGEPDRVIRSRGDTERVAVAPERIVGDRATQCDIADPIAVELGEPEAAVRPRGDLQRLAPGGETGGKFGDNARRGNPANPVVRVFREPEVAVRPQRDAVRSLPVGRGNSVTTPLVVIRPIRLAKCSVNQRLPSGPVTISNG